MSESKRPFGKLFDLRWADKIGRPECPYMTRYVLVLFGYAIRLHHWIGSDDQRFYHDHPHWMLIFILWGSYDDLSPESWQIYDRKECSLEPIVKDTLNPGSIRFRAAEHKHKVSINTKHVWSLLITGKHSRHFGFWIPGRDKPMRFLRYFSRYGHHPCE